SAARAAAFVRIRQRELVSPARGVATPPVPRDADRGGHRVGQTRAARRLRDRLRAALGRDPLARPLAALRVRAHVAAARAAPPAVWSGDDRQSAGAGPRDRRLAVAARALPRRRRGGGDATARRVPARARPRRRLAGRAVPRRLARAARRAPRGREL